MLPPPVFQAPGTYVTKPSTQIPNQDEASDVEGHSGLGAVGRTSSAPALLRKQCPACNERYPEHFLVCPRDATRLRVATVEVDTLIGTVLGATYEVLRMIGEGGMGRVYEARHTRLYSKRFAIKVLHSDLTRQPEVVGRFLREAEATSALHHPNIVGVVDIDQTPDGRPYIVAELLQGNQLGEYFERSGRLSASEALAICRPICQALQAAHEKAIVHRDIKPENVFLVGDGAQRTVKVLDFGISRVGDAPNSTTKTGIVMGTPAYMPPEQARGARIDHRADIYAVGALLYEAVTGVPPFTGSDPVATLGAVLTQEPTPAHSLAPDLSVELEAVIVKAMAKSPDERYGSMLEFDAALALCESGSPRSSELRTLTLPPMAATRAYPESIFGRLRQRYDSWNSPEHARGQLRALSFAAVLYMLLGLIALSAGVLKLQSASTAPLSTRSLLLCAAVSAGVLVVPCIAWAQYLFWHVWPITPRVVAVLTQSRRVLAASLFSYAAGMLLATALHTVLGGTSPLARWPWELPVFPIALVVGAVVAGLERKRPRSQ